MKSFFPILCLILGSTLAKGEEVELKSKDGRAMKATIIEITENAVEVTRGDKKQFVISFEKLSEETVVMLKERKTKIDAEAAAAEAAELARIPEFPTNPKGPADLPQKVVFKMEEGKTFFISLNSLRGHLIEPKAISEDEAEKDGPYLKVSTAFGGGEGRIFLQQKVSLKILAFKYMTRSGDAEEFSAPKEVSVTTSLQDPTKRGSASFSFFSEKVPGDTEEVVLYDFKIAE